MAVGGARPPRLRTMTFANRPSYPCPPQSLPDHGFKRLRFAPDPRVDDKRVAAHPRIVRYMIERELCPEPFTEVGAVRLMNRQKAFLLQRARPKMKRLSLYPTEGDAPEICSNRSVETFPDTAPKKKSPSLDTRHAIQAKFPHPWICFKAGAVFTVYNEYETTKMDNKHGIKLEISRYSVEYAYWLIFGCQCLPVYP